MAAAGTTRAAGAHGAEGEHTMHSSIGLFGNLRVADEQTIAGDGLGKCDLERVGFSSDASLDAGVGTLSWPTVSMIQIGEIIGVGVLTMGSAFADLGFALALVLIVVLGLVAIYTGVLLSRARALFPTALSYPDMALYTTHRQYVSNITTFIVSTYIVFSMASYLLALTQTLEIAFWGVPLCQPLWSLLAACVILVPVQFRTYGDAPTWLFWVNFAWIASAVLLVLGYLIAHIVSEGVATDTSVAPPQSTTWVDFFSGLSKITFAFLGCYIFFEMMAEMKVPGDFPKTFRISGPAQIISYAVVGVVAYLFGGDNVQDSIIKEVDPSTNGALLSLAAVCLALHIATAYVIIGTVFHRTVHQIVSPSTLEDYSVKGRLIWFTITVCTLAFCFVVSNGIGFFDSLVSLLGSIFAPFLAFFYPVAFFLLAKHHAGESVHIVEKAFLGILMLYALVLLFVGTSANIIALRNSFSSTGAVPFQCNMTTYESTFVFNGN